MTLRIYIISQTRIDKNLYVYELFPLTDWTDVNVDRSVGINGTAVTISGINFDKELMRYWTVKSRESLPTELSFLRKEDIDIDEIKYVKRILWDNFKGDVTKFTMRDSWEKDFFAPALKENKLGSVPRLPFSLMDRLYIDRFEGGKWFPRFRGFITRIDYRTDRSKGTDTFSITAKSPLGVLGSAKLAIGAIREANIQKFNELFELMSKTFGGYTGFETIFKNAELTITDTIDALFQLFNHFYTRPGAAFIPAKVKSQMSQAGLESFDRDSIDWFFQYRVFEKYDSEERFAEEPPKKQLAPDELPVDNPEELLTHPFYYWVDPRVLSKTSDALRVFEQAFASTRDLYTTTYGTIGEILQKVADTMLCMIYEDVMGNIYIAPPNYYPLHKDRPKYLPVRIITDDYCTGYTYSEDNSWVITRVRYRSESAFVKVDDSILRTIDGIWVAPTHIETKYGIREAPIKSFEYYRDFSSPNREKINDYMAKALAIRLIGNSRTLNISLKESPYQIDINEQLYLIRENILGTVVGESYRFSINGAEQQDLKLHFLRYPGEIIPDPWAALSELKIEEPKKKEPETYKDEIKDPIWLPTGEDTKRRCREVVMGERTKPEWLEDKWWNYILYLANAPEVVAAAQKLDVDPIAIFTSLFYTEVSHGKKLIGIPTKSRRGPGKWVSTGDYVGYVVYDREAVNFMLREIERYLDASKSQWSTSEKRSGYLKRWQGNERKVGSYFYSYTVGQNHWRSFSPAFRRRALEVLQNGNSDEIEKFGNNVARAYGPLQLMFYPEILGVYKGDEVPTEEEFYNFFSNPENITTEALIHHPYTTAVIRLFAEKVDTIFKDIRKGSMELVSQKPFMVNHNGVSMNGAMVIAHYWNAGNINTKAQAGVGIVADALSAKARSHSFRFANGYHFAVGSTYKLLVQAWSSEDEIPDEVVTAATSVNPEKVV